MSGLFFGLNISLKGMAAQQAGLEVTAHNIANANTEGYSRQRVNLEASPAISGLVAGGGQLGSGVDVGSITRVRQQYLDTQVRGATAGLEYQTVLHDTMEQVETVFMEPTEHGLNARMGEFWNQWQALAADPASTPVRTALKESSVALADSLKLINRQLAEIQSGLQSRVEDTLRQVNSLTAAIDDLNRQIVKVKISGETPNDLMDKRDLLVDQLAALGNITVMDSQDTGGMYTGGVDIRMGDLVLVNAGGATLLSPGEDLSSVTGGMLGGLQAMSGPGSASSSIQYYRDRIDSLAVSVARTVNDVHRSGVDLHGAGGGDYFVFMDAAGNRMDMNGVDWSNPAASGVGAFNLAISPDITADVSRIAAAAPGPLAMEGNGDIALQIAALSHAPMAYDPISGQLYGQEGGNYTIPSFYRNLVTDIGSTARSVERKAETMQALVSQMKNHRESVMGVSLDEESVHMIQYQHAYEACAKVISVIDKMLDTIINGMKA